MGKGPPCGATAFRKLLDSKYPFSHAGEPDDIEWGTVYLATDESKFVTDTELIIVWGLHNSVKLCGRHIRS